MKTKSKTGFTIGLISILVGIPLGYISYIMLAIIIGFSKLNALTYSVYLLFVSLVLALIAICFYFSKARLGAIIMFVAFGLYLTPFVIGIIGATISNVSILEMLLQLIIGLLPPIAMLISAILGIKAKA